MSEITKPTRTIDEITASIMANARSAALSILAIGQDLIDAKAQLGHGEWMPWLDRIGMTHSRAQNYMRLARSVTPDSPMAALPYSKALALLDAPEDVREELLEQGVEDRSAAEIRRLTKELEQTKAQAADYYAEQQRAQDKARTAEARSKALEQRLDYALEHPETVAVEVAPADYQTTKDELARARRELTEAQDAIAEAEERAAKAMQAAQKAGMISADDAEDDRGALDHYISLCQEMMTLMGSRAFAEQTVLLRAETAAEVSYWTSTLYDRLFRLCGMVENARAAICADGTVMADA